MTDQKTIDTARALSEQFIRKGYPVLTHGTDTHQVIIDVVSRGSDAGLVEKALENASIILNRNILPGDEEKSGAISGIRMGTAAMVTRGMGRAETVIVLPALRPLAAIWKHSWKACLTTNPTITP